MMSTDGHIARRLFVSGRVQGVWFRAWMVKEANARGLNGWVRNRSDGSVEALVSGEASAVRSMVKAFYRGPTLARVDKIYESPHEPLVSGSGFIKRENE